jgi:hypothetical protein
MEEEADKGEEEMKIKVGILTDSFNINNSQIDRDHCLLIFRE